MMENGHFNNGNFWKYSDFAGDELCSLETGIPGGPPYFTGQNRPPKKSGRE